MVHRELRNTTNVILQDVVIHHVNMVRNAISGMQEFLQQYQYPTNTLPVISEPNEHIHNAVQNTQHQLAAQLHQMQTMVQDMQLKYDAAPHPNHQYYVSRGYYGGQKHFCGRGVHGS